MTLVTWIGELISTLSIIIGVYVLAVYVPKENHWLPVMWVLGILAVSVIISVAAMHIDSKINGGSKTPEKPG